jgi:metal-responsive CopG/Arc/MetJ family transcriptional regulator
MGRKALKNHTRIHVHLPNEDLEWLDGYAAEHGYGARNDIVKIAIKKFKEFTESK